MVKMAIFCSVATLSQKIYRITLPAHERHSVLNHSIVSPTSGRGEQKKEASKPCFPELLWTIPASNAENHDDVIKWKHFPRYWPFVRGIHRPR